MQIHSFKVYADRYYMNGSIKIKRDVLLILKNMNINVLQKSKEFDYRFVSRLLSQIFDNQTLRNSSAGSSNMRKTAYARLDEAKLQFMIGWLSYQYQFFNFSYQNFGSCNYIFQMCFEFELLPIECV